MANRKLGIRLIRWDGCHVKLCGAYHLRPVKIGDGFYIVTPGMQTFMNMGYCVLFYRPKLGRIGRGSHLRVVYKLSRLTPALRVFFAGIPKMKGGIMSTMARFEQKDRPSMHIPVLIQRIPRNGVNISEFKFDFKIVSISLYVSGELVDTLVSDDNVILGRRAPSQNIQISPKVIA